MALGVTTSFSAQQQIALKLAFMWSAVYTMMSSLGHILLLMKANLGHIHIHFLESYNVDGTESLSYHREKKSITFTTEFSVYREYF